MWLATYLRLYIIRLYIYSELVIISSYPAIPRRITVLVNFQAIVLIFSGETSSNRDIFFTEDAAKNFFLTSKISAQEIHHPTASLVIYISSYPARPRRITVNYQML